MDMGYDLADALGEKRAALMRGHGCVVVAESLRLAVFASVYLEMNAEIQLKSHLLAGDDVTFLSEGEVEQIIGTRTSFTIERAPGSVGHAERTARMIPNQIRIIFLNLYVQTTCCRRVVSLHNTVVRLIRPDIGIAVASHRAVQHAPVVPHDDITLRPLIFELGIGFLDCGK